MIESTLVKKQISILYLPWWYDNTSCNACYSKLTFTSECQKNCANCLIFYTGCRYCLTTNIIFGLTGQSQCKKCKQILSIIIDITNVSSGNSNLDDLIYDQKLKIYSNNFFSTFFKTFFIVKTRVRFTKNINFISNLKRLPLI